MENTITQKNGEYKPPVAFFLMPIDILKGVHEELSELLGLDVSSRVIYNCGFRSGKNIVSDMDINFPDLKVMRDTLPELWLQMGIGVFTIEKMNEHEMILTCAESNEAKAMGYTGKASCDLTCGYLAGMMSVLFNSNFKCKEEKCLSKGETSCLFKLTAVEE